MILQLILADTDLNFNRNRKWQCIINLLKDYAISCLFLVLSTLRSKEEKQIKSRFLVDKSCLLNIAEGELLLTLFYSNILPRVFEIDMV